MFTGACKTVITKPYSASWLCMVATLQTIARSTVQPLFGSP